MLKKIRKEFVFNYPLKHKVVQDLKIVTEHVGDLVIEGIWYFDPSASPIDIFDRYTVDIEWVKWNGTDIKPSRLRCKNHVPALKTAMSVLPSPS